MYFTFLYIYPTPQNTDLSIHPAVLHLLLTTYYDDDMASNVDGWLSSRTVNVFDDCGMFMDILDPVVETRADVQVLSDVKVLPDDEVLLDAEALPAALILLDNDHILDIYTKGEGPWEWPQPQERLAEAEMVSWRSCRHVFYLILMVMWKYIKEMQMSIIESLFIIRGVFRSNLRTAGSRRKAKAALIELFVRSLQWCGLLSN